MILKKGKIQLDFNVTGSQSRDGLSCSDYWCNVQFKVKGNQIDLDSSIDMISKQEFLGLIEKLRLFMEDDFIQKGRISFIKNYFVIYLEASLRIGKRMQIKLVHINPNNDNYLLSFRDEEILEFLHLLENEIDKI